MISPSGVPSLEGIEVGKTGTLVLPFAHRNSWALGGRLAFLGPTAAAAAAPFLVWRGWAWWRGRRRKTATPSPSTEGMRGMAMNL